MTKEEISQKLEACIQRMELGEKIQRIRLFGSHLHGDARENSDVDLLIEFSEPFAVGLFDFVGIAQDFERTLSRKVDLATPSGLSKYIRDDVLREAEVLYEKR